MQIKLSSQIHIQSLMNFKIIVIHTKASGMRSFLILSLVS